MSPDPLVILTELYGPASIPASPQQSSTGAGGMLMLLAKKCSYSKVYQATASWLSKQVYASQFIKLNV